MGRKFRKARVTFGGGDGHWTIRRDGLSVGHISGHREKWIKLYVVDEDGMVREKFGARLKYGAAKLVCAKRMAKGILEMVGPEVWATMVANRVSPSRVFEVVTGRDSLEITYGPKMAAEVGARIEAATAAGRLAETS